jgi:signal transduction histidine kinase
MATDEQLLQDIENVQRIPIVSTMLDVICRVTGMGFAAIARVTQDRWIACSVRDEIEFGLKPGGELKIETTICNEIRNSGQAVIIDHVSESDDFRNHHTPLMYGFESYISVPIMLKTGFFGTLCAIDPKPAQLNNAKTIGMFKLFAELIAFHLQSMDVMERSYTAVTELNRHLADSQDENRQYKYISDHNLQEPLRKIMMFSTMLVNATEIRDVDKAKDLALKINSNAQRFSMMIKDLSEFSKLNPENAIFEPVDLNRTVENIGLQLQAQLDAKNGRIDTGNLPLVFAVQGQMEQLFYHLVRSVLQYSSKEEPLFIHVYSTGAILVQQHEALGLADKTDYVEINLETNGIGAERTQLDKIFDLFAPVPFNQKLEGGGIGLAYCRKIIRNHGGNITAQPGPGTGTIFSMTLPLYKMANSELKEASVV